MCRLCCPLHSPDDPLPTGGRSCPALFVLARKSQVITGEEGREIVARRPGTRLLRGRTVVQVGVPTPDMALPDIPMIDFFGRGGQLRPSWYGDCLPSRDFPMLIDLYLQGRLDLDRFVSETIALDQVEEAFHRMERGEVLRSVVVIGS